ncbi:carboxypeptidase-like regulatory domain-containing protein [Nodosilinea nodulosa]|uniref:carboxypeptidase-like regulatory domain-containing protein n=1 Tax=Nodosilinea nodulosa TaxID=416001 RepID=UPI0002F41FE1|nr:carboxypeptidase-like regulatory domain-containing protein [Nodosilinea nodulosa]
MLSPLLSQSPPSAAKPYRVAIAGTITNALTGDVMPQAVVRITAAPATFIEGLAALFVAAIAQRADLQARYSDLIAAWHRSPAPLAATQLLLDRLSDSLSLVRPDQTRSGGDGHYCFFDLPPGRYRLTATYTLPNHCCGMTTTAVEIAQSDRRLAFAEVDIAVRLAPNPCPLLVVAPDQSRPWGHPPETLAPGGQAAPAKTLAAQPRVGTLSR